jgi:hypothetical protein
MTADELAGLRFRENSLTFRFGTIKGAYDGEKNIVSVVFDRTETAPSFNGAFYIRDMATNENDLKYGYRYLLLDWLDNSAEDIQNAITD